MQVMLEPRLDTEKEDSHLIETFLISTKPNQAGWYVDSLDPVEQWIGKDFVIIPEKIFDLDQLQPGHTTHGQSYEEHMAEIKKNSHGKIIKIKGPYDYNDGTDDKFARAVVQLDNSKAASTLLENGSKTWTKFAVSPTVWQEGGDEERITKYTPMGLFLVIQGAYGKEAVIEKMCSGSKLKCGRALSAAILNLKNTDNDEYVGEVLNSYIKLNDDNKYNMSQVTELKKEVNELPNPIAEQPKLQPVIKEEVKEEVKIEQPKGITLSQEEFESYKKEREEHKQLVLENKTNKLNNIFSVVEDADIKKQLVSKYIDKDVNLLIDFHNDIVPHVEKFAKGKDVPVEEKKDNSKSASIKKEPKKEIEDQERSASVVPNKVNEVLVLSKMFAGEVL